MIKVIIDAGHGGKDPGALGNNMQEKDINLSVTLKVGEILQRHNVEVIYSRTTDVFIELADRASKANNAGVDAFVSIHCNAFTDISARGVETYNYPGSATGAKLSKSIQDSMIESGEYTLNRGTKTENFAVLRLTNMPATLVELAFITNAQDANILKNRQEELAVAVSKGILNYLGVKYIPLPVSTQIDTGLIDIKVNDFIVKGILKDQTYYVPIRVFEKFDHSVNWNPKTNTVEVD